MKNVLFALILTTGLNASFAQEAKEKKEPKMTEADVPAAVKTKFSTLYPGVKAEKWEKENGNFEVKFHNNKKEMSILVDPAGNLMETETAIAVTELPKSVTDYIAKNKAGKKIKDAATIVDAKGTMTYEAEVEKMDMLFDKDGKFIKESKD
jgi:biopolymer transport protein ExbD